MNHDDINPQSGPAPGMEPWIEPELEARVVAWVAGEASPFEIAELERLLTEKPELAVFKRRIEAVQGLVAAAAAPDREPLQLSGPRRAQLLQTLGGGVAQSPGTTPFTPPEKPRPWSWRAPQLYFTLSGLAAACIVAMITIAWDREERVTRPDAALASASAVAAPKPGKLTLDAPASTFGLGTSKPAAGGVTLGATSGSVTFGEKAKDLDATNVSDAFRGQTLAKTDAPRGEFRFVPAESKETAASRSDAPTARPGSAAASDEALRSEIAAATQPESTFSLHVGEVSFRLAHTSLRRGEKPDPARIRPEEFYNAFDYGDPAPTMAEKIGARVEQAAHPFLQQRNLVRIALRVPTTGRGASQPLRLTVLLDTSGSMEREDRAASVQRALQALIALLGPNDRITLIGFARQPRLLAEAVAGNQAGWLVEAAARTPAEGGTNLEAALQLGGELARRHQAPGAQNRVILLTDGAANLGSADPAQLATAIEALRRQGLAFDACGVGLEGLDDAVLEALTRKGDGRYYVLNSPDDADAGFAQKLAGALRPAAENVKLQVRFNPARTGRYRLIGFEQHRLNAEDFRNDQVDAAELAAGEAAVAVYQVEPLPEGTGDLGEVAVRFRDAATGLMVERTWTVPYDAGAPAFARASPSLQLAGTAALLAEKLRGGAPADPIRLRELAPVVNSLRGPYAGQPRIHELTTMFTQARRLYGDE